MLGFVAFEKVCKFISDNRDTVNAVSINFSVYQMMNPKVVENVLKNGLYKGIEKSYYTDDSKVTDHYAIIPTGQTAAINSLSPLAKNVYLLIAALLSLLIQKIPFAAVRLILNVIVFAVLAYLGWKIPTSRSKEINLPNWFRRNDNSQPAETLNAKPKLLDTSAIIDGRFFDEYKTGIIEGKIIVPQFVLDELRHIADSADPLKRARGRRGLDAINALQEERPDSVEVSSADYPDLSEVDTKLLRLTVDQNGVVVTNDYNLGKVAAVQSVPVFNINDLANALRINVVAGELIDVTVVKEGKEHGQGVAYFDDGTMIVIDGAAKLVGETVTASVTSVLQTSAGRMVFAKLED